MKSVYHMSCEMDTETNHVSLRVQALDYKTFEGESVDECVDKLRAYLRFRIDQIRNQEAILAGAVAPEWAFKSSDRDEVIHVSASGKRGVHSG